jgi:phage tail-like protein
MSTITRTDPLRDFKFRVKITPNGTSLGTAAAGIGELGFAVVSGIGVQNEMIPYREGGMNTHPHKMVGQSDFTPVTFSRGVFATQPQMWAWQAFIHSWMQGGAGVSTGSKGDGDDYRCTITVAVFDHPYTKTGVIYQQGPGTAAPTAGTPGNKRLEFKLYNAWPGGFAMSDLNAGASSIMVQQLTVHHEGFELTYHEGDTLESTTRTRTTTTV